LTQKTEVIVIVSIAGDDYRIIQQTTNYRID